MDLRLARIGGLVVVALCWYGARRAPWSSAWAMAFVWLVPPLTFPIAAAARKLLDARPTARRADWVTLLAHYATMIVLGAGIFRAFRLVRALRICESGSGPGSGRTHRCTCRIWCSCLPLVACTRTPSSPGCQISDRKYLSPTLSNTMWASLAEECGG